MVTLRQASVDVDIGGTFTDCLVSYDGQNLFTKTQTTTYDLSVGFMRALREAASSVGVSLEELLEAVQIIRYSTTLAMNRLIEMKGPRLGLITTAGFEDTMFTGRGGCWADGLSLREMRCMPRLTKPQPLIPRYMVVGVKERVDFRGNVVRPLDEHDVLVKLRCLVDQGAQGFAVSLIYGYVNPLHEQRIRELIRREYPESYLGSMPVVLSAEVAPKWREYTRTVATVLNAYLHQAMSSELAGMGDELRAAGYNRSLMMVHNTGGMAEVFRTTALNTFNGGPVAGVIGGAFIGKLHGYDNIVVSDMGGTSFDLGMIVEGSTRFYQFHPVIGRYAVDLTMLESSSIGAGGGSIAWLNPLLGNRIEVGPQSAGSMPGPACYDQGGTEPTVTDADLVLGYLNPDYFHGGKILLSRELAVAVITDRIARPLGMKVEEAAWLIKEVVDGNMGHAIFTQTVLRGYDPKTFILFAFGGAGPTHCCGYGFRAGVEKMMVFPYSPVFCALGSAGMDLVQIYEQGRHIPLMTPMTQACTTDYEQFNEVVRQLRLLAIRDLEGHGFPPESALLSLELDMRYGGQLNIKRMRSPRFFIENEQDIQAIYGEFEREYSEAYSPLGTYPEGGVDIENFVLRSTVILPKIEIPKYALKGVRPPDDAHKGQRKAFWGENLRWQLTNIYEQDRLEPGNIIEGPAIIEAPDTTIVVSPGRRYAVNEYRSGVLE